MTRIAMSDLGDNSDNPQSVYDFVCSGIVKNDNPTCVVVSTGMFDLIWKGVGTQKKFKNRVLIEAGVRNLIVLGTAVCAFRNVADDEIVFFDSALEVIRFFRTSGSVSQMPKQANE